MENNEPITHVLIHSKVLPEGDVLVSVDYEIDNEGIAPIVLASNRDIDNIRLALEAAIHVLESVHDGNKAISDDLSDIGLKLS